MENLFASTDLMKTGSNVSTVFYFDGKQYVLPTTIHSTYPFVLSATHEAAKIIQQAKRMILVVQGEEKVFRAEAQVDKCTEEGDVSLLEVGYLRWEDVDRRRYPRYQVELPVSIKAIREENNEMIFSQAEGKTIDLSLGGALVTLDKQLAKGTLIEFQTTLNEQDNVRALAIVARTTNENEVGIEFLDYIGGARYHLHSFLSRLA